MCDEHIDEVISIGDYVLSGGELAALRYRLHPAIIQGTNTTVMHESFSDGLLSIPIIPAPRCGETRTRRPTSGHHARIEDGSPRPLERRLPFDLIVKFGGLDAG